MDDQASEVEPVDTSILEMTIIVVKAYVGNNALQIAALPALIEAVHAALAGLLPIDTPSEPAQTPAVHPSKSVTSDHIVCLEDGLKFKTLRHHLKAKHNMTPEEYLEKWGLPKNYPFVTASYSAERTRIAKTFGLGSKGRGR